MTLRAKNFKMFTSKCLSVDFFCMESIKKDNIVISEAMTEVNKRDILTTVWYFPES